MSRYIEVNPLLKDLSKWLKQVDPTHPSEDNALPPMEDTIVSTLMIIEEQPTADVVPVRKGKWIRNDNGTYSCSVCNSWIPEEQHYYARYCLHCGASMTEGAEDVRNQEPQDEEMGVRN